jgi:cytochrome c biogenesis protein CcmG, thiol:disulfide interchange protein DsbE
MAGPRFNPLILLPPLLFAGFVAVAFFALKRENPDELPSALQGRPAPSLAAASPLGDKPRVDDAALRTDGVKLVNFWASWCGPCRIEHPFLDQLSAEGVEVIGVNYKDQPQKALLFLDQLGDPFAAIGQDANGRIGLDWGIYGVPETFVVDGNGTILTRYPGPLSPSVIETRIRPLLRPPG